MSGWEIGDRVRALRGMFEGFSGTVIGIEGILGTELDEIAVEVEIFDRMTPVLFPPGDLGPGNGNGGGSAGDRQPRAPLPSSGEQSTSVESR
jgi:hypothetical protein